MGTVGRVHPHLEAKVVDPASGQTLPRGQVRRWLAAPACGLAGAALRMRGTLLPPRRPLAYRPAG